MNFATAARRLPWRNRAHDRLRKLLADCGVELGGGRPFDIRINDPQAVQRIVCEGSLGFGESYMDGHWECDRIDKLVTRLLRQDLDQRFANTRAYRWLTLLSRLRNLQSRARAIIVAERHYDVGNALFERMLDSYMNYSCGYWETANTLEQAQRDKMELICRKLDLSPGMRVLDIGCGWGGMARYASEHYDVEVVGITISRKQLEWAASNLSGSRVRIHLMDYRDVSGEFDRIISVGMFEHVGYKNYPAFFRQCHARLRANGLMLLHTIGNNTSVHSTNPWLNRYIFPNGMLPSIAQIGQAIEPHFVMEDWHSFGADYDRTLLAWHDRINGRWNELDQHYDERFRRMWNFYLLACAGAFRARNCQLWQVVLSKGDRKGTFRRPALGNAISAAGDSKQVGGSLFAKDTTSLEAKYNSGYIRG